MTGPQRILSDYRYASKVMAVRLRELGHNPLATIVLATADIVASRFVDEGRQRNAK